MEVMASVFDREAELFARDLYRYLWNAFRVTSGIKRREENKEKSSFTPHIGWAVIYTEMRIGESLKDLFQKSLTDASMRKVFEELSKKLNASLVLDEPFRSTVKASAIIAEFILYQYNLGEINYLLYGESCWTSFFNIYLRTGFYEKGGWKSFVEYAEDFVKETFNEKALKDVETYVELHRDKSLRGKRLFLLRTKDLPLKSPKQDLGVEEAEREGEENAEVRRSSSRDSRHLDDNQSLHPEAAAKLRCVDIYPETSDSYKIRHPRKSPIPKRLASGKRMPSEKKSSISSQDETENYRMFIAYLQTLYDSYLTLSSESQTDSGKEDTETSKSSQDQSKEGAQENQEKCKLSLDPKAEQTSEQASAEEVQDKEVTKTPKKGKKKRRSSKKH